MPAPRLIEMAYNYNCGCVGACQGVKGDEKPRCASGVQDSVCRAQGVATAKTQRAECFKAKVTQGECTSDQTAFGLSATVYLIAAFTSDRTRVCRRNRGRDRSELGTGG